MYSSFFGPFGYTTLVLVNVNWSPYNFFKICLNPSKVFLGSHESCLKCFEDHDIFFLKFGALWNESLEIHLEKSSNPPPPNFSVMWRKNRLITFKHNQPHVILQKYAIFNLTPIFPYFSLKWAQNGQRNHEKLLISSKKSYYAPWVFFRIALREVRVLTYAHQQA